MIKFTIYGEAASKANSRKKVTNPRTGKPMFIKSKKARGYANAAAIQAPLQTPLLEGRLCATIHLYYRTERPDLDESALLDALEDRIYVNDSQVREKHIYHGIDKANPRAEVEIECLSPS